MAIFALAHFLDCQRNGAKFNTRVHRRCERCRRRHIMGNNNYSIITTSRLYGSRYFQHAHFIPIVSMGKKGVYSLVHVDLPRQHSFGTTLRFTGPVPADSRQ